MSRGNQIVSVFFFLHFPHILLKLKTTKYYMLMFLGGAAEHILPRNKLIQAFPYMNIKSFFRKQMHKKHSGIVNLPIPKGKILFFCSNIYLQTEITLLPRILGQSYPPYGKLYQYQFYFHIITFFLKKFRSLLFLRSPENSMKSFKLVYLDCFVKLINMSLFFSDFLVFVAIF